MERGTVVSIDRPTNVALVALHGGSIVPALWLGDNIPPPRSVVLLEATRNDGQRVLLGNESPSRRLFVEDFMGGIVRPTATLGYKPLVGDGNWTWDENTAGTTTVAPDTTVGIGDYTQVLGSAAFGCGAVASQWFTAYKGVLVDTIGLPSAGGVWMQIRMAVGNPAGVSVRAGLADIALSKFGAAAAGSRAVLVTGNSGTSANWILQTINDAGITIADSGKPVVANEWLTFDVVGVPGLGGWFAMYINGTYACSSVTNIPTAPASTNAHFGINPLGAAARTLRMDLFTMDFVDSLRSVQDGPESI